MENLFKLKNVVWSEILDIFVVPVEHILDDQLAVYHLATLLSGFVRNYLPLSTSMAISTQVAVF